MRLVAPGSDGYLTEKYAFEIETIFNQWGEDLKASARNHSTLANSLSASIQACSLTPLRESTIRSEFGIDIVKRSFPTGVVPGRDRFLESVNAWLGEIASIETAEFEIYAITETVESPLTVQLEIRYDLVGRARERREERIGSWRTEWSRDASQSFKATKWEAGQETICRADSPVFADVTVPRPRWC